MSRQARNLSHQISELGEEAEDDAFDSPEFEIGDIDSTWLPPTPQKLTARRRLDRFLEQRRLDLELQDLLDDDDDENRPRRRRWRRIKHKPIAGE